MEEEHNINDKILLSRSTQNPAQAYLIPPVIPGSVLEISVTENFP